MARGGVGTVVKYKIKNGYRYKAVVQHYGKKYIEGGFLTVTSARDRAWNIKQELLEGTYEKPRDRARRLQREKAAAKAQSITVEDYATAWMDELRGLKAKGQKSANTIRSYKSILKNHVIPHLGAMPLSRITPEQVKAWHQDLILSKSVARAANAYRVFSSMMNHAVDAGLIAASPCKVKGAAKLPQSAHQREQHYFTHDEYQALYATLRASDMPSYAAIAALLYYTACRPSEARALRVGDVDLENKRVTFSASLQRGESGEMVEGPTKTKRTRYAPLAAPLLEVLAPLCEDRDADEWLFPAPTREDRPPTDRHLNSRVRKALDAIGLPDAELYDLKHTCLTNLGRAGASLKELMDLPGHTQVETVLKYQLADFDRVASAVERMAERLEG